jgi:hypothetical protein
MHCRLPLSAELLSGDALHLPPCIHVLRARVQFVLNTSRDVGDLRELLSALYDDVFVEHVVKSPCYVPGQPFSIQQFNVAVDRFFLQRGLLQLQVG